MKILSIGNSFGADTMEYLGRYIAGLTYGKALCGWDISQVNWYPEGVTREEAEKAKWAAISAVNNPYSVTTK